MPASLRNAWRDAIRDSNLDPTAKLVGFVMSTYMNTSGDCWPSVNTIAKGCGLSRSTVIKALRRLEAAGFLATQHSAGRVANRYLATFPTVSQMDGSVPRATVSQMDGSVPGALEPTVYLTHSNRLPDRPEPKRRTKTSVRKHPPAPPGRAVSEALATPALTPPKGRPRIGDPGYPELLAVAFGNGHVTEVELEQAFAAHEFVRARARESVQ